MQRVNLRRGNPDVEAHHGEEPHCYCRGSTALMKGLHLLRPELSSAADKKKQEITELVNRDEYSRKRKRSAAALSKERATQLRAKLVEWTNVHDRQIQGQLSARAKTVAAAAELNSAIQKNVDASVIATLRHVHHLTMVVERSCANNLRRFAEKVEHYSGRVRDCEEEANINADELQQFELQFSTVEVSRGVQLQSMESVLEFLQSAAMEGN